MSDEDAPRPVIVPHGALAPDALAAVIEEYVSRDGTELSDAVDKSSAVVRALRRGELVLAFDPRTGSCTFVPPEDLPRDDPRNEDGRHD